jgi:cation diffusion facilitator CzcD-associated flavoprotein CzcO
VTSGFDREAIQQKYAEERARRMAADRSAIEDLAREERFAGYLADPFTPFVEREPVADDVDVAIVGAGIAGVVTGAKLRDQGDFSIRLIDTAGGVGGTWYWNRYPGVMCDVESYIYMPMLEEMDYVPTRKYAFGEEIREHIDAIAHRYDLVDDALFHTRVEESRWDEDAARWVLTTDRGDEIRARFLVMAVGILNLVKLPAIPGMETFRGKAFHSSRWDYEYTGGGPGDDRLTKLADKVVGVIGTGATAIQCIPPLAESAKHVYVFQRTPSAIGVRNNFPTPEGFVASLRPGWQKDRMENFTAVMAGKEKERDLVADAWTAHMAKVANPRIEPGMSPQEIADAAEEFDYLVMEEHRRRVEQEVADAAVAEILKPYYRYLCKRPCFHDEYLATFNKPNVTLVDCPTGVEEVTEDGVVANGQKYDLDCIVYATGFYAEVTPFPRRAGHPIIGRGGVTMAEKWKDGACTLHGMLTRGFPNLFISPAPGQQAVVSVNHTHIMVTGAEHIAAAIAKLDRAGVRVFDVTEEAEADWVAKIEAGFSDRSAFMLACTPSRINFDSDPSGQNPRNGSYGGGYGDYFGWKQLLDEWIAAPDFPGLEIER